LKEQLEREWDGKPKKEGVTVVKGGRVLRDSEELAVVFEDELKVSLAFSPDELTEKGTLAPTLPAGGGATR
jgi:hypothetical protein